MPDRPRLRKIENFEELRMECGLAAGNLHNVRMGLVSHDRVQHAFDLFERTKLLPLGAAFGVTYWAAQIAGIADFHQREARVLLMVGAKSAVIRATPSYRGVVSRRHFRRFDKDFAAPPVIVHVVGQEDFFGSVSGAMLQQEDIPIFKDDFSFQLAETRRADRQGNVIKKVRPHALSHNNTSIRSFAACSSNHGPHNSAKHHDHACYETNCEHKSKRIRPVGSAEEPRARPRAQEQTAEKEDQHLLCNRRALGISFIRYFFPAGECGPVGDAATSVGLNLALTLSPNAHQRKMSRE